MIRNQFINPAIVRIVANRLSPFFDEQIKPHLSDVNGSLLGIEQSLEDISRSLHRIAESQEKLAEHHVTTILRNEGVEPW